VSKRTPTRAASLLSEGGQAGRLRRGQRACAAASPRAKLCAVFCNGTVTVVVTYRSTPSSLSTQDTRAPEPEPEGEGRRPFTKFEPLTLMTTPLDPRR
jgi:hypothetical protein